MHCRRAGRPAIGSCLCAIGERKAISPSQSRGRMLACRSVCRRRAHGYGKATRAGFRRRGTRRCARRPSANSPRRHNAANERMKYNTYSPSVSSPDPRAHDQAARPRTRPAQSPTGARPFSRPGSRRTPRPCASCSPCQRARRLLLAGALGARARRSVSAGGGSVSDGARCGSRGGGAPAQRDDDMLSQRLGDEESEREQGRGKRAHLARRDALARVVQERLLEKVDRLGRGGAEQRAEVAARLRVEGRAVAQLAEALRTRRAGARVSSRTKKRRLEREREDSCDAPATPARSGSRAP